jgi:hypothetical protein
MYIGSPGFLIKCNSFAESPNLVQQTGPYSASLLISCSVTTRPVIGKMHT